MGKQATSIRLEPVLWVAQDTETGQYVGILEKSNDRFFAKRRGDNTQHETSDKVEALKFLQGEGK